MRMRTTCLWGTNSTSRTWFIYRLHLYLAQLGSGLEMTTFYKRLASLIAARSGDNYIRIMQLICCCLSFAGLRSFIFCIRGMRSANYHPVKLDLLGLIESETHLTE